MFLHEEAENVSGWFNGWDFDPIAVMPVFMLFLVALTAAMDPDALSGAFAGMVVTSPIWLPIVLFVMFWKRWIHYVRFATWFRTEMVLLHIELPPEVEKSPLAMELVLTHLHNGGGEYSFIGRYWDGKMRGVSSLELVSNGGRIGYYVHLRKGWKEAFESRLYGQFPEARVTQVEKDYVVEADYSPETHGLWGCEFKKRQNNAMPIRTYIDWQLDKNPDTPETQTDPITHVLEFLSSIGPDERVWVQFIIRTNKGKNEWYAIYNKKNDYADSNKEAIEKIMKEASKRAVSLVEDEQAKAQAAARGFAQLTPIERLRVEALERNAGKAVFDCGIRILYLAKKESFNGANIGNVVNFFGPFNYAGFNGFTPTRGLSLFNFPWQDWNGIRENAMRKRLFFWYKYRAFFFVPLDQDPSYFTTEELASLWHFPSSGVKTPGLQRVPSRVSEAPVNLPTAPTNLPTE